MKQREINLVLPAGKHRATILACVVDTKRTRMLALRVWNSIPPFLPFTLQLVQEPDGQWAKCMPAEHPKITTKVIEAWDKQQPDDAFRASGRHWVASTTSDIPFTLPIRAG